MTPREVGDDDTDEKENSARERSLRVLTWNVNRAEPSGAAFDAVFAHVRSLTPPPHVIALQLASKDFAVALASGLGWSPDSLHHSTPGSGWGSEPHGNAVLTDFSAGALAIDALDVQLPGAPPRSVMCVQVMIPERKEEKEQEQEEAEGEEEAVGVDSNTKQRRCGSNRRDLAPEQEVVWVCSIHLDNTREDVRMKQAKEAARRLRSCGPHVLCGDFNALLSRDFAPGAWARLNALAADNGWEPREDRVMRYLLGKRKKSHSRGGTRRTGIQGSTENDEQTSSRVSSGEKEGQDRVGDDDECTRSYDVDVNDDSGGGGSGGRDAPDEKETGEGCGVHYEHTVGGEVGRSADEVGAGYDDAWEAAGTAVTGRPHTFRLPPAAGNTWVRLDYVLLSDSLAGSAAAAEAAEVEGASNHCPVTVDLRLH